MEAIAERGRTAMQWLLVLGVAAAWAMFDRSPRVVDAAREVVDTCLMSSEGLGVQGEPLDGLSPNLAMLFRQYRHEHLRYNATSDAALRRERSQALEPITIGAAVQLGNHVLAKIDALPVPGLRETLIVTPLRQSIARLETWQTQAGLGPAASLAQVETELRSRVPIPGTEQAIPVEQCMLFVGCGLFALQLYLASLLRTLRRVAFGERIDRSWVVLHFGRFGAALTISWLSLPTLAWLGQALLRAVEVHQALELRAWLLGSAILAATVTTLWQVLRVRRDLLGQASVQPIAKVIPTRSKAA